MAISLWRLGVLDGLPQRASLVDRCIVATTRAAGATLVTADPLLLRWTGDLQRLQALG